MDVTELDYAFLQREGIRCLENMSGTAWTDFNSHDPGITIMEQVCWALTDLGYRLDHPIADLLSEGTGEAGTKALRGIAPPAQALGCAPVTLNDLRRLMLDIEGVSNVWIEPEEDLEPQLYFHRERHTLSTEEIPETQPLKLQGLWRVRIARDDRDQPNNATIKREAVRRLHAHRPLGIDFTRIEVLPVEEIMVQAHIEIGGATDAEALMVALLQQLSGHISPRVAFQTLQQRLAADTPLEALFDGPNLDYGFIDDGDLPDEQRRSSLRTSDLIQLIMGVPGVRAVRHIQLAKANSFGSSDIQWQDWELKLDYQEPNPKAPRLHLKPGLIQLYRQQVPVRIDTQRVLAHYQQHMGADARRLPTSTERMPELPTGRDRHIARYHSILHHFPEVYGVGQAGLSPDATAQRQAEVKQLKAYLQLFDQLLADQFAQAANAAALLAGDDPEAPLYATGKIQADGLGLDQVRTTTYQDALNQAETAAGISPEGISLRRRQLDHLLARVGETFVDPVAETEDAWDGLEDRRALLAGVGEVTAHRGNGTNSLQPFSADNRGGLERRIALKLGLHPDQGETFLLVEHVLMRALPGDQKQSEPLLAQVASADPYSLQLSFVFPGNGGRFAVKKEASAPGFRGYVEHLIREETPAHLSVYVHWLSATAYKAFEEDLAHWHTRRRDNLLSYFNIQEEGAGT